MGEENYRNWNIARIQETPVTLFLSCLAGNTLLTAGIGVGLIFFGGKLLIPLSIGLGIILYAVAVVFLTLLAVWRIRRAENWKPLRYQAPPAILVNSAALKSQLADSCACETSEYSSK